MNTAASKMYRLLELINEVNAVSSGLPGIGVVFGKISLNLPKLEPSELGFIRVVSWLYVHYYETGRLGTEFLGRTPTFKELDNSQKNSAHRLRVQQLRTFTQHNLQSTEPHSTDIEVACIDWFRSICNTPAPGSEEHWKDLLFALVDEAEAFLTCLRDVLRSIESDDSKDQILQQWILRITRFHAPHEFDRLIAIVATDIGRDAIDVVKFRKRHYDQWRREFELRTDECNFAYEARKLIEHAMLSEQQNVLPLDGNDLMNAFSLSPGKEVAEILQLARKLFDAQACNKDELIAKIRESWRR